MKKVSDTFILGKKTPNGKYMADWKARNNIIRIISNNNIPDAEFNRHYEKRKK